MRKTMSELILKNEKTGAIETFEIEDAEARRQISSKASNEELNRVFGLADENINRLFKATDNLSTEVDKINATDKTKGVSVSGTTLVIKV